MNGLYGIKFCRVWGVLRILFFLILSFEGVSASINITDSVTCGYSPPRSRSILSCKEDERIHILNTTVAFIDQLQECRTANIIAQLNVTDKNCQQFDPVSYDRCHGEVSCEVEPKVAQKKLSVSCPTFNISGTTNVFHIRYSCMKVNLSDAVQFPIQTEVRRNKLQIFSPYYPCHMPEGYYNFHCTIRPPANKSLQLLVDTTVMSFGENSNCQESLRITKKTDPSLEAVSYLYCSRNETRSMTPVFDDLQTTWTLNYTKTSNGSGGRFWIEIRSSEDSDDINITIECNNQQLPVIQRNLTTKEVNNRSRLLSDGCIPNFWPKLVQQNPTDEPENNNEPDGKVVTVNYEIIVAIIGGVVGLVVVVIFIILISTVIEKARNSKKRPNRNLPNTLHSNSHLRRIKLASYYNTGASDVTDSTSWDIYAVIDKTKKTSRNSRNIDSVVVDDTIMVENNDLYDTRAQPLNNQEERKSRFNKNKFGQNQKRFNQNQDDENEKVFYTV